MAKTNDPGRAKKLRKKAAKGAIFLQREWLECVELGVGGCPSVWFVKHHSRTDCGHDLNAHEVRALLQYLLQQRYDAPKPKHFEIENPPFLRRIVTVHLADVADPMLLLQSLGIPRMQLAVTRSSQSTQSPCHLSHALLCVEPPAAESEGISNNNSSSSSSSNNSGESGAEAAFQALSSPLTSAGTPWATRTRLEALLLTDGQRQLWGYPHAVAAVIALQPPTGQERQDPLDQERMEERADKRRRMEDATEQGAQGAQGEEGQGAGAGTRVAVAPDSLPFPPLCPSHSEAMRIFHALDLCSLTAAVPPQPSAAQSSQHQAANGPGPVAIGAGFTDTAALSPQELQQAASVSAEQWTQHCSMARFRSTAAAAAAAATSTTPTSSGGHPSPCVPARSLLLGLDCEMVLGASGASLPVRVSVVDWQGQCLLDVLVRPSEAVADWRTQWSGVSQETFSSSMPEAVDECVGGTCKPAIVSFEQAHCALLGLLLLGPEASLDDSTPAAASTVDTEMSGCEMSVIGVVKGKRATPMAVLVGHSLQNDLVALRLLHPRCIDTAVSFAHPRGFPSRLKLKDVSWRHLGWRIQQQQTAPQHAAHLAVSGGGVGVRKGHTHTGHDSVEDATAALLLATLLLRHGARLANGAGADVERIALPVAATTAAAVAGSAACIRCSWHSAGNPLSAPTPASRAQGQSGSEAEAEVAAEAKAEALWGLGTTASSRRSETSLAAAANGLLASFLTQPAAASAAAAAASVDGAESAKGALSPCLVAPAGSEQCNACFEIHSLWADRHSTQSCGAASAPSVEPEPEPGLGSASIEAHHVAQAAAGIRSALAPLLAALESSRSPSLVIVSAQRPLAAAAALAAQKQDLGRRGVAMQAAASNYWDEGREARLRTAVAEANLGVVGIVVCGGAARSEA